MTFFSHALVLVDRPWFGKVLSGLKSSSTAVSGSLDQSLYKREIGFSAEVPKSRVNWSPTSLRTFSRSEERRVGKEWRSRWAPDASRKKEREEKSIETNVERASGVI